MGDYLKKKKLQTSPKFYTQPW